MNITKTSTIELDLPANDCWTIKNLKVRVKKFEFTRRAFAERLKN